MLLPVVAAAVTVVLAKFSDQSAPVPGAFKLRGKADNPDAFYLCATGRVVSCGFIYDPHAADDWLFRTADGSLCQLGRGN